MNRDETAKTRVRWLELAKRITERCMNRRDKLSDLCPPPTPTDSERKETLKAVCALNREIAKLADQMAEVEATVGIGTGAILKGAPENLVRIVVSMMTAARLSSEVNRELRHIEDVVELASGRDAEDAVAVRNLFRSDGLLRPHITVAYGATLDESAVRLREASLNRILNQPRDESERLTDAAAFAEKWR